MKTIKNIVLLGALCLAAMAGLQACDGTEYGDSGRLSLVILDSDATKTSSTTELSYEKVLNNIQILIFEGETLFKYLKITEGLSTLPYSKTFDDVKAGAYNVYVVANASDLNTVSTLSQLSATTATLADCGLTDATGFVMCGSQTATVTNGGTASAAVSLKRLCARVRLVSVVNDVPSSYSGSGSITLKGAFLINGHGTSNLSGDNVSEWVNLGGRKSGRHASETRSDYITSSSDVSPAAYVNHVFHSMSETVARGATKNLDQYFYSMPNAVTTDHTGNTATSADGAMTRLVVLATVNGTDYWYPVTLFKDGRGVERNTSYDVRVTIKATGSDDPNTPVGKGNLTATVSVSVWQTGAEYTEEI